MGKFFWRKKRKKTGPVWSNNRKRAHSERTKDVWAHKQIYQDVVGGNLYGLI